MLQGANILGRIQGAAVECMVAELGLAVAPAKVEELLRWFGRICLKIGIRKPHKAPGCI